MPKSDRRDNTTLQAVLDLTTKVSAIQTELAVNTTETKNIVTRLDKLNGTVAEHQVSLATMDQAVALLTQSLSVLNKANESKEQAKNGWLDWLLKGIVVIGLLLFYSLLTHAGVVQDFLQNLR